MDQIFKKILCAIEFDDNSARALDLAASLASQNDALLHALHVVSVPASALGYPGKPYKRLAQLEQKRLEEFIRAHVPAQVPCEITIKIGDAVREILATAEERDVDLIVMASHRRSGIPRLVLGSVADGVVRGSTRTVLMVRPASCAETLTPGDHAGE